MPDPLSIHAARTEDLAALLTLYQHLIPGDAQPSHAAARSILTRFHAYPGSQIFLGSVAGQPVSSCTLVVVPNLTRGGSAYGLIENVVTHSDHRQRGYGLKILSHAAQSAWQSGCYKIMLLTGSTDPATHAFYRAAGFENTKTGYQMRAIPSRDHGAIQ